MEVQGDSGPLWAARYVPEEVGDRGMGAGRESKVYAFGSPSLYGSN